MLKRLAFALALSAAVLMVGDTAAYCASCKPLSEGTCRACKNCKHCKHCAKKGGKCSVCDS